MPQGPASRSDPPGSDSFTVEARKPLSMYDNEELAEVVREWRAGKDGG